MNELKTAVVLINLGSPESPSPKALRKYLAEFLSDRYVVEISPLIWWCILHGIILPFYAKRSAEKYQKIWSEQGSPLITLTMQLADALEKYLRVNHSDNQIQVKAAMRYGSPSLESVLSQLKLQLVERVIFLPLYPQYAQSTVGSTAAKIKQLLKKYQFSNSVVVEPYYANIKYTTAIAHTITEHVKSHGKPQHIIFSFHGLPLAKRKPYFDQCQATVDAISKYLNLAKNEISMTFQSRFGPNQWLQPYTQQLLESLPKNNIKNVAVVCPGFAVDCLETLEEINIFNRKNFILAGGKQLDYIPALNDSDLHVKLLGDVLEEYL